MVMGQLLALAGSLESLESPATETLDTAEALLDRAAALLESDPMNEEGLALLAKAHGLLSTLAEA